MAKVNDDWTVGPHGPLERLDDGLLTVAAEIRMPLGNFPRRMTVAALANGGTAIWSAVPLREPEMREIEALGPPAYLIVPGVAHRLDIRAWKRRYPYARVVCPPGAQAQVEKVIRVDVTGDPMGDRDVRLETVPGVGEREVVMFVRRGRRHSLVVNDILANVRHPNGLGAHIMARLLGFGVKRPQMPRIGRRMFVEDSRMLAEAFRTWAVEPGLARIIVSHGDVIDRDVQEALERVARDLDR